MTDILKVLLLLLVGGSFLLVLQRPGLALGASVNSQIYTNIFGVERLGLTFAFTFIAISIIVLVYRRNIIRLLVSELLFGLFLILCLLSLFVNDRFGGGFTWFVGTIIFCFGYYFVGRALGADPRYRDKLIIDFGVMVTATTITVALILLASTTSIMDLIYFSNQVSRLGKDSAVNPVAFSIGVDIAAAFCLLGVFLRHATAHFLTRSAYLISGLVVMAVMAMINVTGSFVSILAVGLLMPMIYVIFSRYYTNRSISFFAMIVLTMLVSVPVAAIFLEYETIGKLQLTHHWSALAVSSDGQPLGSSIYVSSTTIRLFLYGKSVDMFLEAPVFGHGLGSFQAYYPLTKHIYDYPHNLFLELLTQLGIVGFIIFGAILVFHGRICVELLRASHFSKIVVLPIGIFLVLFLHHQVSFAFWMGKYMFLSMGILAALYQEYAAGRLFIRDTSPIKKLPQRDGRQALTKC